MSREIENNAYASIMQKFWGVNKVYYGNGDNSKFVILYYSETMVFNILGKTLSYENRVKFFN